MGQRRHAWAAILLGFLLLPALADTARAETPASPSHGHADTGTDAESLDLSAYRRSDGTLDWNRLAERFKSPHDAMKNVSLVFFFDELARVIRSGSYDRIGELFDGLANTSFFTEYGLFTVGYVGASEIFAQGLEPSLMLALRGSFVRSVLRSQVAMAAGMALPRLATGSFNGKVYAIDLASMGLSSLAVTAALQGLSGVVKVATGASVMGGMGGMGHGAAMGAGPWGYLYTFGEMALMFYFGDMLSMYVQGQLDERAQARGLEGTSRRLIETASGKDEPAFASALDAAGLAFADRRTRLLAPLVVGEGRARSRLKLAWGRYRGLIAADRRLRELASTEAFADAAMLERSAKLLDQEGQALKKTLAREVVQEGQRRAAALEKLYALEPRSDPYVAEAAGGLRFGRPTKNRSGSYDQEREVYLLALKRAADAARSARLQERLEALDRARTLDHAIHHELLRAEREAVQAAEQELKGQATVAIPPAKGAIERLRGTTPHATH